MRSLADVAEDRRVRQFVGRSDELAFLTSVVASERPDPPVVFIHGPGGVGKTSLLEAARRIAGSGRRWVWLDAARREPTPPEVGIVLGAATESGAGSAVVVLDGLERLTHLERWLTEVVIPGFPDGTAVLIASRRPPGSAWVASSVIRPLLHPLPLRNLPTAETRLLLSRLGVDTAQADPIIAATHGHPLAVALFADHARRTGRTEVGGEVIASLLRSLIGHVPDERLRRALEVCALARVTTEDLLRSALEEPQVGDVFGWLREQCFIESTPDGLSPHDVVRNALDADLSWRDPQRHQALFRGISRHLIRRMKETSGAAQHRAILDAKYMHRHHPVSRGFALWETFGQSYAEPARDGDIDEIAAMVAHWQGPEAARLARMWHAAQPEGCMMVRHADGRVCGTLVAVDLTAAPTDALARDPVAAAARAEVDRRGEPRSGERVTLMRFVVDRDHHQESSPTWNAAPIVAIQHYLTTPGLAANVICMMDTGRWDEYFAFFEIPRVEGPPIRVGDRRFALFVRDFRRIPLDDWLTLMLERDLSGLPTPLLPAADEPVALARPEFARAVHDALRALGRPAALAGNPLTHSRLIPRRAPDPSAELGTVVRAGIAALASDPRDEHLARVLRTTFGPAAPTREGAARRLGLPMTTYKRHLRRGIGRVTEILWEREISGT